MGTNLDKMHPHSIYGLSDCMMSKFPLLRRSTSQLARRSMGKENILERV
jgi:hypothetical protein